MAPRLLTRQDGQFVFTTSTEPYAILSHRWGEQELTYKDIIDGTGQEKEGYAKLQFCADQAEKDNLKHFWIDTCCINKSDDAEVSTAIKSMFRWYKESRLCYVYLTDVSLKRGRNGDLLDLRKSDWFKRGWTLQELLAPKDIHFFAKARHIGTRATLCQTIHEITGIEVDALRGDFFKFSHNTRISWAAKRETKIPEDKIYALMGICDISMSPRYGESLDQARQRLESKIIKRYGSIAMTSTRSAGQTRQEKLDSLNFSSMHARRETVNRAFANTCEWLLNHPIYKRWLSTEALQHHHGFLWIKGKPGAGKSVLIKYLDKHVSQTGDICVSFYFNARGEQLDKSMTGMYRSLLVQLMEMTPSLQHLLDAEGDLDNLETIKRLLLKSVLELSRSVWIIVDALDECQDDDVQRMIDHFRDLCLDAFDEQITLRIAFASRHYPIITIPTGLQLVLEEEVEHAKDLSSYIDSKLVVGTATQAETVKKGIVEKANIVFLWVVLVVEILNREFRNGRIHAVQSRLQQIPSDLKDLFSTIILRDNENVNECVVCIRWILYAREPLDLTEFYFAMMAGLKQSTERLPQQITEAQMQAFLLSSSKGLAELTKAELPKVQFIHESVRDYLILDGGLSELSQEPNTSADGHEALMQCCLITMSESKLVCEQAFAALDYCRSDNVAKSSLTYRVRSRYPLLKYVIQNVLWHAEMALPSSQETILRQFDPRVWRHADTTLNGTHFDRNEQTLVAICNQMQVPKMTSQLLNGLPTRNVRPGEPLDFTFEAACRCGSQDYVQRLLESDVGTEANLKATNRLGRTALIVAASHGQLSICTLLIDRGADLHATDDNGRVALHLAALEGHAEVCKLLLDLASDIEAKDNESNTALLLAAHGGHFETCKLLLSRSADVEAKRQDGDTALLIATRKLNFNLCELLINAGASPDAKNVCGLTPLHIALIELCPHPDLIEPLLRAGADVHQQDVAGRTPLHNHISHGKSRCCLNTVPTSKYEI